MEISPELLGQIVAHVQEDPRNECCGVVAVQEGSAQDPAPVRAMQVYRARNIHESPLKFEIDPQELLALWKQIQQQGWELGAIYHSHVRSAPVPSQTDINFSAGWPGVEWIIVGLVDPDAPDIRSFLIDAGKVQEVEI